MRIPSSDEVHTPGTPAPSVGASEHRNRNRAVATTALLALLATTIALPQAAQADRPRAASRPSLTSQSPGSDVEQVEVNLYNINTRESATYWLPLDGVVPDEQADEIARFFRCKRTDRQKNMDQRVLSMLADLSRHFEGRTIHIVSGYRHPPHASKHSRHRHAAAIDLNIPGVKITDVRNYIWATHTEHVGVGYYKQKKFIHMDNRPEQKSTSWTQIRPNTANRYNPGWATKIRRAQQRAKQRNAHRAGMI